jgi:hypothetical protein
VNDSDCCVLKPQTLGDLESLTREIVVAVLQNALPHLHRTNLCEINL